MTDNLAQVDSETWTNAVPDNGHGTDNLQTLRLINWQHLHTETYSDVNQDLYAKNVQNISLYTC